MRPGRSRLSVSVWPNHQLQPLDGAGERRHFQCRFSCFIQGFTLATDFGFMAAAGSGDANEAETSVFSNDGGPITLTRSDDEAFDFHAIDLGPLYGSSGNTRYVGPVMFTGTRADGTTLTAIRTLASTRFQTFRFTGFTHLASLTFVGSFNGSVGSIPLFNNVVLSASTSAAAVSEAATPAAQAQTAD